MVAVWSGASGCLRFGGGLEAIGCGGVGCHRGTGLPALHNPLPPMAFQRRRPRCRLGNPRLCWRRRRTPDATGSRAIPNRRRSGALCWRFVSPFLLTLCPAFILHCQL